MPAPEGGCRLVVVWSVPGGQGVSLQNARARARLVVSEDKKKPEDVDFNVSGSESSPLWSLHRGYLPS
eukprot:1187439-Ditylum_brightwellii.AAC.1